MEQMGMSCHEFCYFNWVFPVAFSMIHGQDCLPSLAPNFTGRTPRWINTWTQPSAPQQHAAHPVTLGCVEMCLTAWLNCSFFFFFKGSKASKVGILHFQWNSIETMSPSISALDAFRDMKILQLAEILDLIRAGRTTPVGPTRGSIGGTYVPSLILHMTLQDLHVRICHKNITSWMHLKVD